MTTDFGQLPIDIPDARLSLDTGDAVDERSPDVLAQRESSRFEGFFENVYGGPREEAVRRSGGYLPPIPPYWPGERIVHEQEDFDFTTPQALEEAASLDGIGLGEPGERIDVVIDLPEDLPFVAEAVRDAIDYYQTYTNVDLNLVEGPVDLDDHDNELIVVRALDDWSDSGGSDNDANAGMFSDHESNTGFLYVNPDQNRRIAEQIGARESPLPEGSEGAIWFQTIVHEFGHRVNPKELFFHVSDRESVMNSVQNPDHMLSWGHLVYSPEELAAINGYTQEGGYRDTHGPLRFPSDGKTLTPLWENKKVVDGKIVDTLPFGIDPIVDGDERFAIDDEIEFDPELFEPSSGPLSPSAFTDFQGAGHELWEGGGDGEDSLDASVPGDFDDVLAIEPFSAEALTGGAEENGGEASHEAWVDGDLSLDLDLPPIEPFVADAASGSGNA